MIPTTTDRPDEVVARKSPPSMETEDRRHPLLSAARVLQSTLNQWTNNVEVDVANLLEPLPPARPDEWSGFVEWHSSWLAVSLPDDATRDLFATLIDRYALRSDTALEAATLLQSFGIAALSVRDAWVPSARSAESRHVELGRGRNFMTSGDAPRQLAQNPARQGRVLSMSREGSAVLHGMRIIDMGRLVAAPLAAQVLEELGAEVVHMKPVDANRESSRELRLDLHRSHDRQVFCDLAATADMLIENCSAAAGHRLTEMLSRHPPQHRLSIRGFAPDSPHAGWRAYGFMFEAPPRREGSESLVTAPAPMVAASRVPVVDRATGLLAAARAIDCLLGPCDSTRTRHTLTLEATAQTRSSIEVSNP